jgi:integrase
MPAASKCPKTTSPPLACPMLPSANVRGNITSHRGRSTIASQLFNANEPMKLFELQEWLGHSTISSRTSVFHQ